MSLTPATTRRIAAMILCLGSLVARGAAAQEIPEGEPPGALLRRRPPPVERAAPRPTPPCAVTLSLRVQEGREGVRLTAIARSRVRAPISLALPDECAGGPVRFLGLPAGYDAYGGCNRGPCVQGPGTLRLTIPPGGARELTTVLIAPDGDACNQPLPTGRYELRAVAASAEAPVCAAAPAIYLRRPRRGFATPPPGWQPQAPGDPLAPREPPERREPPREPPERREPPPPRRGPGRCPPPIPCAVYCPFGMARSPDGCSSCACNPSPFEQLRPQ